MAYRLITGGQIVKKAGRIVTVPNKTGNSGCSCCGETFYELISCLDSSHSGIYTQTSKMIGTGGAAYYGSACYSLSPIAPTMPTVSVHLVDDCTTCAATNCIFCGQSIASATVSISGAEIHVCCDGLGNCGYPNPTTVGTGGLVPFTSGCSGGILAPFGPVTGTTCGTTSFSTLAVVLGSGGPTSISITAVGAHSGGGATAPFNWFSGSGTIDCDSLSAIIAADPGNFGGTATVTLNPA